MAASKRQYFEYIVIGCGGIGSGALYWLSKRSSSVLGLEQFSLGHERGGSQDVSRIIRLTYHDDRYTRLTPDTFKAYDRLSNLQLMARYPQFTVGPDIVGLYQEQAGLVDAAVGNAVHIQLARGNGATVLENCPATRLTRANNGNVIVHTTKGVFECRKVVVTAGGWLNTILGTIGVHVPVTVTQEQVTYYATPHMKEFTKEKHPIWLFHCPRYDIYALPIHGNTGSKIGVDAGSNVVTADTRTFEPDPVRERTCTELLQEICPKFLGPILQTKTCLYAMTPDRHFVVDTCAYKGWSDVIVCCGAGHAYKFASLLGKVLSDLAVDGRTQYDISQFNITRDAIQDPTFKLTFFLGRGTEAKL
ncbi:monomeric sarcosine oxidase-like isoform X2 [Haliotis rufescens]|uniref:monomeric sarcosine oxidase-like isoform X2 n=1 Tax=Haliotis rufescens TaxID=6454 RepID=UPI00201F504A|nr:monomeric sarcosine oxidase-like isoform X2 [Haliotis rufescens]